MTTRETYIDLIEECIETDNLDVLEKSKLEFEKWSKCPGGLTLLEIELYTMICLKLDNYKGTISLIKKI